MSDSERAAAVGALVAAVQELADYRWPEWSWQVFREVIAMRRRWHCLTVGDVPLDLLSDVLDALARVEATEAKEADRA